MYFHYDLQNYSECYSKLEFIHFSVQLLIVFHPENISFMQFSQKIAGFRQKDSQGF